MAGINQKHDINSLHIGRAIGPDEKPFKSVHEEDEDSGIFESTQIDNFENYLDQNFESIDLGGLNLAR